MSNSSDNFSLKRKLKEDVWEKPDYCQGTRREIRKIFFANPGLVKLLEVSRQAKKILDCGCGDGRIIEILWRKEAQFWGIDLSGKAIESARKRLKGQKNVHLNVGDIEKIGFPQGSFDLVYTTYTLEHLDQPERGIEEMIRVTQKGGQLIIVCPNYGSPFHPSSSSLLSGENLFFRALKIFLKSHLYLLEKPENLTWRQVEPRVLKESRWQPDWDTVVEPNIQTLLLFLKERGMTISESSSGLTWQVRSAEKGESSSDASVSFRQRVLSLARATFEFLGKKNLPPYCYFGPTIFIRALKNEET